MSGQRGGDEATVALVAKGKKKKVNKKGPKEGDKKKKGVEQQQRDMSKVKCFACHKFGHYVVQCPNRKKKQVAASADVEDFASTFEREFSLIACLSACSGSSRDWYIDNGASAHMTGVREVFSEITERGIDFEVELGDDMVVRAVGKGTVAF